MALILTVIQAFASYVVGQDITDSNAITDALATHPSYVVQVDSSRTAAPPPSPQVSSGVLVTDTATSAYLPILNRPLYLELAGAGSFVGGAMLYECDDGSFAPTVSGVVAYNGAVQTDGVRIRIVNDQGKAVQLLPGVVTGPVTYNWSN